MKSLVLLGALLLSSVSFAQTKMGPEAVEMFELLTTETVRDCLQNVDLNIADVKITKTQARCPGCNSYSISGYKKMIDTVSGAKLEIVINTRGYIGAFGKRTMSYTCEVRE